MLTKSNRVDELDTLLPLLILSMMKDELENIRQLRQEIYRLDFQIAHLQKDTDSEYL